MPESVLVALACSLDAFAASFAYGAKGIKIPLESNQVINLVSCSMLGLSLWAGSAARRFISPGPAIFIAFAILFVMGLSRLLDSAVRALIRKSVKKNGLEFHKHMRFSAFNVRFILSVIADPEEADVNNNKVISPAEAAALAVSLSLDGLAVGFGAAVGQINIWAVLAVSFAINTLFVFLGSRLGGRVAKKLPVSWLSGLILIGLAVSKLL